MIEACERCQERGCCAGSVAGESELAIATSADTRLLVRQYENGQGRRLVTVAPQYRDRSGQWRLAHEGLILSPDAARELGPALATVAATIDADPQDPMPTEQDREESRTP
jgi:hypothetical protein